MTGVSLEENRSAIKDACWLYPDSDIADQSHNVRNYNEESKFSHTMGSKDSPLNSYFFVMMAHKYSNWYQGCEMLIRRRLETLKQGIQFSGRHHIGQVRPKQSGQNH